MRNPLSRFSYSQSDINIGRSRFDRTHDHKTTISAGKLYPILCDEVLPGDTYSVDLSSLVRMSTPIHPVMDNCFLDTYWFFVPNRIVWDHWKEFMGESPSDPYISPVEYTVPRFYQNPDPSIGGYQPIPHKSLLDYLGAPAGTAPSKFSQLQVRGFCKIWNEWFRDQNLQNAINVSTGDEDMLYSTSFTNWAKNSEAAVDAYVENAAHGGDLPPVNKYHDYFTSALKEPQKGDPVGIPLSGFAPVYATNAFGNSGYLPDASIPVKVTALNSNASAGGALGASATTGNLIAESGSTPIGSSVRFSNLGADLSNVAGVYATISDLRYAFQLQKFMEADNRGGTRYREILKQHFNVTSPDASMQIPEFLGGKRIPINISQVLQTSSTDDTSPQGNTAAYSLTSDKYSAFTKSFTEHGFIFCVACIRTAHTYSQGLEKMWFRFNKFDYYFPEFANISEMPIYNKEIYNESYIDTDHELGDGIFGYQEAWAEYRYKPNRLSAEFRPNYVQPLDIWHYGDDYEDQPFLSAGWIRETRKNIDRTLAVSDDTSDQFICDFYFKLNTTRVMPMYSIPGLADHH